MAKIGFLVLTNMFKGRKKKIEGFFGCNCALRNPNFAINFAACSSLSEFLVWRSHNLPSFCQKLANPLPLPSEYWRHLCIPQKGEEGEKGRSCYLGGATINATVLLQCRCHWFCSQNLCGIQWGLEHLGIFRAELGWPAGENFELYCVW